MAGSVEPVPGVRRRTVGGGRRPRRPRGPDGPSRVDGPPPLGGDVAEGARDRHRPRRVAARRLVAAGARSSSSPSPVDVLERLWQDLGTVKLWNAIAITLRRGITGFALAIVIGVALGLLIARFQILRAAIGSLITGLQTMPSIAWFPLAILLFKLSEQAITFVVILGAAPSIANGLIHGVDHIPPVLRRAGRVLGARGLDEYRYVVLPAAMPSFVAGLKRAGRSPGGA